MYNEKNVDVESRAIMKMWVAVLYSQFSDAVMPETGKESSTRHVRRYARQWLTTWSPDFKMVCEFAGYFPPYVHECAVKFFKKYDENPDIIKRHNNYRKQVRDGRRGVGVIKAKGPNV